MSRSVDPGIFKAYDIRGIYPDQIDEEIAYRVGRAFVSLIQPDEVVVGRDMRLSSESLAISLINGILEQGANVLDIGMVSTDQYYFACATSGSPGLMVTASHNPKEYNGFKMVRKMPYLLSRDEGIRDIQSLVETENLVSELHKGTVKPFNIRVEFAEMIHALVDRETIQPLHIVVDTANGMVGPIVHKVYGHMPVKLTGLYLEPDGNLPNHGLDPLQPENRAELQRRVVEEKADIGFAFDGDGDRFFCIDDRGAFVPGDFLTAIMADYLLRKNPGSKIIYDIRASWAVPDTIKAAGGEALVERVGHAFIKKRMADENALFAGEVTGHYYFRDFFFADSGILPSLIMLELLSKTGKRLSELLKPFEENYFISGELNTRVKNPAERTRALLERYHDGRLSTIDGISVDYPTWRFNVRPSNTEPFLRLNLESVKSQEEMEKHRDEILAIICAEE